MTADGLVLIALGAVAIVSEAHVPALGMLGGPGLVALVVGAVLAVGGLGGGLALSLLTAAVLLAVGGSMLTITLTKGAAVRRRRVRAGPESLIGHVGVIKAWGDPTGSVFVDGALWKACRSASDDEPAEFHTGDPVVVEHRNGLTLAVRRAEEWELMP